MLLISGPNICPPVAIASSGYYVGGSTSQCYSPPNTSGPTYYIMYRFDLYDKNYNSNQPITHTYGENQAHHYSEPINSVENLPAYTRVLCGGTLSIFDYAMMWKLVTSTTVTNVQFIVCIDASTCIAVNDGVNFNHFKVTSNDFSGGLNPSQTTPTMAIAIVPTARTGLSKVATTRFFVQSFKNYFFINNVDTDTVISTSQSPQYDIGGMTAAYSDDGQILVSYYGTANYWFGVMVIDNDAYITQDKRLVDNHYLYGIVTSLALSHDGQYISMNVGYNDVLVYEKKPCHTSCATCSDIGSNACTLCVDGTSPSGGTCNVPYNTNCKVTGYGSLSSSCVTCPIGKFKKEIGTNKYDCVTCVGAGFTVQGDQCVPCGPNCNVCESVIPQNCISCITGSYFDAPNKKCTACNTDGYVISGAYCLKCGLYCSSCISTNTSHCTSCTLGYFLYPDNTCGVCAEDGVYQNGIVCSPCAVNCKRCVSGSVCLECNVNYCVYNSLCLSMYPNAPVGYYDFLNSNVITCALCNPNCVGCLNTGTHCTSCSSGKYLTVSYTCDACDVSCKTCSGSTDANCLVCAPSYSWSIDNKCMICGDGNYTTLLNQCLPCTAPCKNCQNPGTVCLSCLPDFYMIGTVCDPCTAPGEGKIGVNCVNCSSPSDCMRCDSNSSSICTDCFVGKFLRLDSGNKCTSDCPSTNYYFTNGSVTYCDLCNANCLTCSASASNCTSCIQGMFVKSEQCVPCGQYIENCDYCTNETHCTVCKVGKRLTSEGTCIDNCTVPGWYASGSVCSRCNESCLTCLGSAASCTSCIAGQYLSATNTCVPCTENGYYHNSTNCLQCDSSCLTCNGSTSTDCLTCPIGFVRTVYHACQEVTNIGLKSSVFRSDIKLATFEFTSSISPKLTPPSQHMLVSFHNCSASQLKVLLASQIPGSALANLSSPTCIQVETGWQLDSFEFQARKLNLHLSFSQSVEEATLLVRMDQPMFIVDFFSPYNVYPEDYLIVENVTVIKSALDGMIDSAGPVSNVVMGVVQVIVMTVSIPQAIAMLKVLQSLDYYLYIDCSFPENVATFLNVITNSPFDISPNFFEPLTDDEGTPVYERFAAYGLKVHFFANTGSIFTTAILLFGVKVLLWLAGFMWRKCRGWSKKIDTEVFAGLMEGSNLEFVMAIILYIGQRDRINHLSSLLKYLVIVFVSLFSLFMISMYLFMGYTVSRLTDSYFKHAIIEVKRMKHEKFKFWLEDKNMHGNIFQRHFNLIQLFKDIVFAALLYALYYKPLVLIILLTLIQAVFMACVFAYPPYNIAWMNKSLKATQTLYLLLDAHFLILIGFGASMSHQTRYNYVGFGMMITIATLIGTGFGFSTCVSIKEIYERFKSWKEANTRSKVGPTENSFESTLNKDSLEIKTLSMSDSKGSSPKNRSRKRPRIITGGGAEPHNPEKLQTAKADWNTTSKSTIEKVKVKPNTETHDDGSTETHASRSRPTKIARLKKISNRTISSSVKVGEHITDQSLQESRKRKRPRASPSPHKNNDLLNNSSQN